MSCTISFALDLNNNPLVSQLPPSPPESNTYNFTPGRNMSDYEFIKSWGYPFTIDIDVLLNNSEETRAAKRNRKRGTKKVPRPPNSFFIYRRNKHAEIKLIYQLTQGETNEKSANFSKIIGKAWRSESENVRDLFSTMAREAERLHKIKYPDYEYKPKSNKRIIQVQNENISETGSDWSDDKLDLSKYLPSPTITNTSTNTSSSQSDTASSTDSPSVDMGEFSNYNDNTDICQTGSPLSDMGLFNSSDDNDVGQTDPPLVGGIFFNYDDFLLDLDNPDMVVDGMQYQNIAPDNMIVDGMQYQYIAPLHDINSNDQYNENIDQLNYPEFDKYIKY